MSEPRVEEVFVLLNNEMAELVAVYDTEEDAREIGKRMFDEEWDPENPDQSKWTFEVVPARYYRRKP